MAKYKVGDKVRIVSERPASPRFVNPMVQYLGKTLTVSKVEEETLGTIYRFQEATYPASVSPIMEIFSLKTNGMWAFFEDWISGLAEPEREPCTVELRFDGMITTATLKRGGRDVKTTEARCNPKDAYSRAEGARVAVERLFEKKKEPKKTSREPKFGDKFVIIGNSSPLCYHFFDIGEVVTFVKRRSDTPNCSDYINARGIRQHVIDDCVKPYEEK